MGKSDTFLTSGSIFCNRLAYDRIFLVQTDNRQTSVYTTDNRRWDENNLKNFHLMFTIVCVYICMSTVYIHI
jgi:hypothetical protein